VKKSDMLVPMAMARAKANLRLEICFCIWYKNNMGIAQDTIVNKTEITIGKLS
jgi:hypothetical protein